MVYHPPGIVIEIVGTDAGDRGHTCEEHPDNCGVVLEEDVVVRLNSYAAITSMLPNFFSYLMQKIHLEGFRLSHRGTLVGS